MVQMSAICVLKARILRAVTEDQKWKDLPIPKRERILKIIDEEFDGCTSPRVLINPKWLHNLYKRIKEAKEQNES